MMRKSPTASARPSVKQGGRGTPSPVQNSSIEYKEERPSILSLFFVVLLTVSFIAGLVMALFFAYAHEIEQRQPPTVPPGNASTKPKAVIVVSLPTAPPTIATPGARKATGHLPRETSGRPSKRAKKRRRRKKPATVPYTSSSPSSYEEGEGLTTTAVMGRDRFTEGVGRPEIDSAKANATRSTPETTSPFSRLNLEDATGLGVSPSTEATTLDELTNDETTDTAPITSPGAATPITPLVERTEENREPASPVVDQTNCPGSRWGLTDEFEEGTGTGRDDVNETKVTAQATPLEESTEPYDEPTVVAAGLDEVTGLEVQEDSAETEATVN